MESVQSLIVASPRRTTVKTPQCGNGAQESAGSRGRRAVLLLSAVLFSLSTASVASAQAVTENLANYGTLSQLNSAVSPANTQLVACFPTSVTNGLIFLNKTYGPIPGLIIGTPGYGTVNALITSMNTGPYPPAAGSGTTYPNGVGGLASYLTTQNVNPPVYIAGGQIATGFGTYNGQNIQNNTNPTPTQIYNWLVAGDAVQIGIILTGTDGNTAGHFVSVYGINIASPTTGTLLIEDPFGGTQNSPAAVALNQPAVTYNMVSGQMNINGGYTGNANDPDGPSNTGPIVADLAEAVVPEPSSFILLGLTLLVGFCIWRLRSRSKTEVMGAAPG